MTYKPCSAPGCHRLTLNRYCYKHEAEHNAQREANNKMMHQAYNKKRDDVDRFYGSTEWRKLRDLFIAQNPLCVQCEAEGITKPAKVVDHIKPMREHPDLALDINNLRALCHECHNAIGARPGKRGRKKRD